MRGIRWRWRVELEGIRPRVEGIGFRSPEEREGAVVRGQRWRRTVRVQAEQIEELTLVDLYFLKVLLTRTSSSLAAEVSVLES